MTTLQISFLVALLLIGLLLFFLFRQIGKTRRYRLDAARRQTSAFEMGANQARGDMHQLLGTFAALEEYEQLMLLSSTSKQGSLDLLGITGDEIHFIEFKKKGAALQPAERKVKTLVDARRVRYVIKEVELPPGIEISERQGRGAPAAHQSRNES